MAQEERIPRSSKTESVIYTSLHTFGNCPLMKCCRPAVLNSSSSSWATCPWCDSLRAWMNLLNFFCWLVWLDITKLWRAFNNRLRRLYVGSLSLNNTQICSLLAPPVYVLTLATHRYLSLHLNGHFSRWTWVSRCQNVSILDFLAAKGDEVVSGNRT